MKDLPTISPFEVFRNRIRILRNPLPFHHQNFERLGDLFRVKIGRSKSIVFTRDPIVIRHILRKEHRNYEKSTLQTEELARYIGRGLLTSNGDHWRTHRRMVQPAFHKKKLVGLLAIMKKAIEEELQRIPSHGSMDIFPLMGDLAFQVVAKTLFSRPDIRRRMQRLQDITARNQKMLIREMRQPYFKWWFTISGQTKRHLNLAKQGQAILNEIVEERIASAEEKDDLLDMLLKARYDDGSPMPRGQLIDEVTILFTAGHETTANAMSFTLFLLAKHPLIQEQVYREVSHIDWTDVKLMDTVTALQYTRQCIEEALRLYPPVYIIDRVAIGEDTIRGRVFPGKTLVLMSVFELHRHRDFWEDAERYKPERFAPENKKDYTDYFYPFGAGPRMCVGNNFAMYEMVMAIGIIIKRYELKTTMTNLAINPLISLKPSEVPLQFLERSG